MPRVPGLSSPGSHFLAIMGQGEEALEHGRRAVELDPFNPFTHSFNAAALNFQRRYDEAIEWLERGFEVRDPAMPYLGVISCYDIVRDDPRFQDLLRKMKLPVDLGR